MSRNHLQPATGGFSYEGFSQRDVTALRRHATKVIAINLGARQSMLKCMWDLGNELHGAQARLAHQGDGTFNRWCRMCCEVSIRSAYRAIAIYRRIPRKDCDSVAQTFQLTAVYKLTADSVPDSAIQVALRLAREGEVITCKRAKEIIESMTVQSDAVSAPGDEPPPPQTDESDWSEREIIAEMMEKHDLVRGICTPLLSDDELRKLTLCQRRTGLRLLDEIYHHMCDLRDKEMEQDCQDG